jgi:chemotaxis methyl-accepting protein methylase
VKRDLVAAAGVLLKVRAGLHAEPMVRARLARCLDEGAARLGLTAEAYLARIETDPGAFQELLDRVTVQHSSFFRDPNQFAALSTLLATAPGPAWVWSAACANGQEPYSLAILLEECGREDWQILATDVSSSALARVRAGRYTRSEVAGLSEARLQRFFTRVGHGWEVAPRLRERVLARVHNLSGSPPPIPGGSFSIIFCRNVLIYFDAPMVDACVSRMAACLPPGGHLFLGFSESLPTPSSDLQLVRVGEAFVYRKGPAPVPAAAAPRRQAPIDPLRLLAEGERASAAGNTAGAVRAFRKLTYLDPTQPVGYFQLGTALEHAGDHREARRAFAAAGSALARSEPGAAIPGLEGYSAAELGKAIAAKLGTL